MGYTHYWTQKKPFTTEEWEKLARAFAEIVRFAHGQGYGLSLDNGDTPLSNHQIAALVHDAMVGDDPFFQINGMGHESCETFMIHRNGPPHSRDRADKDSRGFDFCKTRNRGYDDVVTATLIVAESWFPHVIEASSDGDSSDWMQGLAIAVAAMPDSKDQFRLPASLRFEQQWEEYLAEGATLTLALRRDGIICLVERMATRIEFPAEQFDALKAFAEEHKKGARDTQAFHENLAQVDGHLRDLLENPGKHGGKPAETDIKDFPAR